MWVRGPIGRLACVERVAQVRSLSTKHSSDNRERRGAQFLDACRGRAGRLIAARPRRDHGGIARTAAESGRAPLDQQQALLIAALRRARGAPVSYQELRDAGIEYPASVVSELELAGLPLERCYEGPFAERRLLGVRLEAHDELDDTLHHPPGRASVEQMPTPVADWLERAAADLDVFRALRALERSARRGLAWLSAPAPVAAQARGHALLEAGQAESAVPVLQQALAASGESPAGCVQPVSETCLSYAYALFDLGRALRLDHQPAAAALILERRLQIANQRAIVQS